MEALKLVDSPDAQNKTGKVAELNTERCIGCGVCAYKCPTKSLVLQRREIVYDPPNSMAEYGMRFVMDRQAAQEQP